MRTEFQVIHEQLNLEVLWKLLKIEVRYERITKLTVAIIFPAWFFLVLKIKPVLSVDMPSK